MAFLDRSRKLIPVILLLLLTAVGVRTYVQTGPVSIGGLVPSPTVVYIKPRTGVQEIARLLQEAGVIRSAWAFLGLAYLQGSLSRLHAGEYEFSPAMSLGEILRRLEGGRVVTHQMTIPEGFSAQEVGRLLASEKLVSPERFDALVADEGLAARLKVPSGSLEGYLFPDTYRLTRGMDEAEILRIMVSRFWQAVPADFAARAERVGLELHEAVTLASLIEKEAAQSSERRLVSAVFHNRLRRGMPLQSDPTAVYRVERPERRITARDLQRKSPYNTYLVTGLPPGPIANPGLAALEAAVSPAAVPYLYFVAKNDGSHQFSRTLEQHQRAVRLYQGGGRGRAEQGT
jgi:UPF0755 protein